MRCVFCGSDNERGAVFCSVCGRRLDGKVRCPACGGYTYPGNFCNICGSPLKNTVRCPKCGEEYEGDFCPRCGTAALSVSDVRPGPGAPRAGIRAGSRKEEAVPSAAEQARTEKTRRVMSICASVLGAAAILAVLVFTFFTGMTVRGSAYGVDVSTAETGYGTVNLYHFFYRAFANIFDYSLYLSGTEKAACYCVAVLGLLISAGMILTMIGMTCRCAVKAVRALASKTPLDISRDVALTYMLYAAFCLMFRGLLYEYESYSGVVAELDLNGATITGLAVGGVLAAASLVCGLVGRFAGRGSGLGKAVSAVVCTALFLVSAWLVTGKATGFTYGSATRYSSQYCFGFLKYAVYFGSSSVLAFGLSAQIAEILALLLIGISCARLISSATDPGYKFSRPVWNVLLLVCAAATLVTGIYTAAWALDYNSYLVMSSMEVSDVANIIAGAAACAVGVIVSLVAGGVCSRRMKRDLPPDGPVDTAPDEV